jgi:hypothetical protein
VKIKRPKSIEPYLWSFVFWVRYRSARGQGPVDAMVSNKSLECAAQIVEQVLEDKKNPLPKQRGRKLDVDSMWLSFHMLCVVPMSSPNSLPRHSQAEKEGRAGKRSVGGFVTVGKLLNIESVTVRSHVYKAFECWKTTDGRQQYINWLNRREKIWAAYQASIEKRKPDPREYVLSAVVSSMICTRSDELGEDHVVFVSPRDRNALVKEARKQMNTPAGKKDFENWFSYRNQLLYIPALLHPSKTGRKRK